MRNDLLRYSDIVGAYFYHIGLSKRDKDLLDTYFTGAAHHLKRFHESVEKKDKEFHLVRHRSHLRLMMLVVYKKGKFNNAQDPSNRGLEKREIWNPDYTIMPDPNMFRKMIPDWRFLVGEAHCSDHYLHACDVLTLDEINSFKAIS
jgi:hypothetical protein